MKSRNYFCQIIAILTALEPEMEICLLVPDDREITGGFYSNYEWDGYCARVQHFSGTFLGHSSHDKFFLTKRLRNGWFVDRVDFLTHSTGIDRSGSSVVEKHVDTNPYVKVNWWVNAPVAVVTYTLSIYAKGPKGVHMGE